MKWKRVNVRYKERKKERKNLYRDGMLQDSQDTKHKAQWIIFTFLVQAAKKHSPSLLEIQNFMKKIFVYSEKK
jgi:predicted RNA-binding protein with PUA domain